MKTVTKSSRHVNGTTVPIKIEVIGTLDAATLLGNTRQRGTYARYIPQVINTLKKLGEEQHAKIHTPQIAGRTMDYNCKRSMSVINAALRERKINHRLRHVMETDLLVSEPFNWGADTDN